MTTPPSPLVPENCDLRDFLFTPIEFQRLFASESWLLCSDAEKVAFITLLGQSWSQLPAGSMPSDDRLLAHLSGAGSKWKKVKAMAMRGWVLCSDGRYYHPIMCEKALEAWLEKLSQRISSGSGNQARWGAAFDAQAIADEYQHCRSMLAAINPKSRSLSKKVPKALQNMPVRSPDGTTSGVPSGSQGTGTGTGNIKPTHTVADSPAVDNSPEELHPAAPTRSLAGDPAHWFPDRTQLDARLVRAGIPPPDPSQLPCLLGEFQDYHEGKRLTDGQCYVKFTNWIRRARDEKPASTSSGTHAGSGQPDRKPTPVEQVIAANRQFLIDNGIDPDGDPVRG